MTFLLDQDVPDAIARVLAQSGHQAMLLRDHLPIDSSDEAVLALARSRNAVLVTCNRDDFLALAAQMSHPGIVMLIRRASRSAECASLLRLIERAGEAGICNNINFA